MVVRTQFCRRHPPAGFGYFDVMESVRSRLKRGSGPAFDALLLQPLDTLKILLAITFFAIPACCWASDDCESMDAPISPATGVEDSAPAIVYRQIPGSKYVAASIPEAGLVESTSGRVQFNSPGEGWLMLPVGYTVRPKQKILIGAGAELVLRFTECEQITFEPATSNRYIELQLIQNENDT
jgi:hypothetical protein